jgi:putative hydrolase of the HAD superfamily
MMIHSLANSSEITAPLRLDHIEDWIFDLDNTLYPASSSLFPQIDLRMRRYIADALHLSLDDAFALQKRYYHQYGTTLRGLMLAHDVEPAAFLSYVHDIDHSVLQPAPRLAAALDRLPGRKVVYTNGSERHAINVLAHLGLSRQFAAIFDIVAAGYIPKPDVESYARMMARHAIDGRHAIMFEDLARNLLPAADAGMTTVWVRDDAHSHWTGDAIVDPVRIHHITDDLTAWLEQAGACLNTAGTMEPEEARCLDSIPPTGMVPR